MTAPPSLLKDHQHPDFDGDPFLASLYNYNWQALSLNPRAAFCKWNLLCLLSCLPHLCVMFSSLLHDVAVLQLSWWFSISLYECTTLYLTILLLMDISAMDEITKNPPQVSLHMAPCHLCMCFRRRYTQAVLFLGPGRRALPWAVHRTNIDTQTHIYVGTQGTSPT